nr:synaptophysin-like [Cherax quadricarinatus]
MKVLQFIFSICAFATTTSFSTYFTFNEECLDQQKNITIRENISYPFRIDSMRTSFLVCDDNHETLLISGDFSSDAQFFVAVGVLALLYAIGAIILYCLFSHIYDSTELVPVVDCGLHIIFTVLWLAASSAWANSVVNLRWATNVETIISENEEVCKAYHCTPEKEANYAKLAISLILGFLNVFLWASNLWFLYKETHYFKDKANAKAAATNAMGTA